MQTVRTHKDCRSLPEKWKAVHANIWSTESWEKSRGGLVRQAVSKKYESAVKAEIQEKNLTNPKLLAEEWFRKSKIEPVYLKENTENFSEMRQKLNSEPGILIANHPGTFDSLALLSLLERQDVRVLVENPELAAKVADIFGQPYAWAIPEYSENPNERRGRGVELMKMVRNIQNYIQQGGLVVFYPTGGREESDPFKFEELFGLLIQRVLRPNDMVYTCWIDEEDIGSIGNERIQRTAGIFSDTVFPPVNINKAKRTKQIRVDERYSKAVEWKELLQSGMDSNTRSEILTKHFLDEFGQIDMPEKGWVFYIKIPMQKHRDGQTNEQKEQTN